MAKARHQAIVLDLVGEVLERRGSVWFTVTSASMAPEIRPGDRVEVARLGRGGPGIGEVVLYLDDQLGHVLHRVIWRWPLRGSAGRVYTKGDAVPYRDAPFHPRRALGRMVRLVRGEAEVRRGRLVGTYRWVRSAFRLLIHGAAVRTRRLAGRREGGQTSRHPEVTAAGEQVVAAEKAETAEGGVPRS